MGMCRIVLCDNALMHLQASSVLLEDGHLKLKDSPTSVIAIFAPGSWRYYVWVRMASA